MYNEEKLKELFINNDDNQNSKVVTKIYDKDKTICYVIKHRNKIDKTDKINNKSYNHCAGESMSV